MSGLALSYQAAGKLDQALPLFEQAAVGSGRLGLQYQNARGIIPDAIAAYEQTRQFDKAEAWRRKWLAVVKAEAGATSPAYAGELAALGSLLLRQQKWAEAETILREGLAIREATQPDAWTTFNMQSVVDGALLGQKKYADAEPLLLKGYEGMKAREKTIPKAGGGGLGIPEAIDRLVELYTATGKPDEVRMWRAERAKYPEVALPPREK